MATETMKDRHQAEGEPKSGIPGRHELGESRKEGLYVVLALVVFVLIALGFWFEATR